MILHWSRSDQKLGWKTTDELIASESNIMVFKSLHDLTPWYMCNLFTKTSQLSSRNLRNTATDLRLPKETPKMDRNVSPLEVLGLGMASRLSVSRHPPCTALNSRCLIVNR